MNKRNLYFLFVLTCLFSANRLNAQMDVQLNAYFQNPYYINPAYIDDGQLAVITIAYRNQWFGFNGAPVTLFGSGNVFLKKPRLQIGTCIFYDKIGYTSVFDAAATYAYNFDLNEKWMANLGAALSYQALNYDVSQIKFEDNPEWALYDKLEPKKGFNTDVGAEVYNENWRFGAAGRNLLSLFRSDSTAIHQNTNYLYGIYRQRNIYAPVDFGVGLVGLQYGNRMQGEINATAYFKKQGEKQEMFHLTALYRTPKEVGAIFGINLTSDVYMSYCYDYNFGLATHNLGSVHEIMISYKINPAPVCRTCIYP